MELVLPSGRRVRVKLKKHEFDKIEHEVRLYRHPKVKRTLRQWVYFLWTRKVLAAWIRIKQWVKKAIRHG
jgi:hypothetical protein